MTVEKSTWRRLGLMAALSAGALSVRFFGNLNLAYAFHRTIAYYIVLAAFGLWLWAWLNVCRGFGGAKLLAYIRDHWVGGMLIVAGMAFTQIHEAHVLRVLHDESTHAATALTMHLSKVAMIPGKAHYVGGAYMLVDYYASFRQYLFPLLLSLLHDLTGYRVENVYVLNAILGVWALIMVYVAANRVSGKSGALVAVGLLFTLPLFAQNVNSGGYDILNLAMVGTLTVVAMCYSTATEEQDRLRWMNLGTSTAVLLALSRYESVAYLVAWAAVVALRWAAQKRVELTKYCAVAPLFVLPNLVSNLILFQSRITAVGPHLKPGHSYFEVGYLGQHLAEAVYYFFQFDLSSTNSLVLSIFGGVGAVFLLVTVLRKPTQAPSDCRILLLIAAWTAGLYLVILMQYWSSPTDNLASRFTLPLHLMAVLAAGWFFGQLPPWRWKMRVAVLSLSFWTITCSAPASSRAFATNTMAVSRGEAWLIAKAMEYDRESTLFIGTSNVHLIARRFATISMDALIAEPWRTLRSIKAGIYKEALVYQVYEKDPKTGDWRLREGQGAGKAALQVVAEKLVTPTYRATISRVVGYYREDGTLVNLASNEPALQLKTDFKTTEAVEAYQFELYP